MARHERGFDAGIVLYPVAVLLLVARVPHQLHFAAIGWALLAFGDGVATLAGKALPSARLPWNRDKSLGWLSRVLCRRLRDVARRCVLSRTMSHAVVLIAALAAAIAESLPLGIDDNLTVPFAAAVALIIAGIDVVHPSASGPIRRHG